MGPAGLVDTPAHLADHRLAGGLEAVLERARAARVGRVGGIWTPGEASAATGAAAPRIPRVFAAVGNHPNHVAEAGPGDWDRVRELARHPRVVAVGETGLDRYWDRTPFPMQQESFDRHLDLARDLDLPVVIHCRDC